MENIKWARVDMGLLVKCSTQYFTSVCSERVSIEFNTWREVLYLKATRNYFFYDINIIGLYWQEKFDSINWLMMNAMQFIYQPGAKGEWCVGSWLAIPNTRKNHRYLTRIAVTAFFRAGNPRKTPQFRR